MGQEKQTNAAALRFERLTKQNFDEHALDAFVRHQEVTQCWRRIDGEWRLLPIRFTEDWNLQECRRIAGNIAGKLDADIVGYGAFDEGIVVGFITIGTACFGSRGQYVQLAEFEVSEDYRGMKIGKQLFALGCEAARALGAGKLYISAHSSMESQEAYRALGCVHAEEINAALAEAEPCDVQMEYTL